MKQRVIAAATGGCARRKGTTPSGRLRGADRGRALGERGGGPLERDARKPVQPDDLDQLPDLGLGAVQAHEPAVRAQPAGEHREIEHQREVGEDELGQIDDHIGLGAQGARQGPAP